MILLASVVSRTGLYKLAVLTLYKNIYTLWGALPVQKPYLLEFFVQ